MLNIPLLLSHGLSDTLICEKGGQFGRRRQCILYSPVVNMNKILGKTQGSGQIYRCVVRMRRKVSGSDSLKITVFSLFLRIPKGMGCLGD